ncbi:hypothetical protein OG252_13210 [Streptomyces sp. NBC_01352]|uniref:hypothetical protein n=1 Tax=Streptomyces sp. NBC_01352 TaxID=2903834 RepID=UPI002E33A585|nr:hypothetical protein [Streptomyces sp. NBC_01352]
MGDTFGGEHRRPRTDGRGHSQRELQDRASFDNAPQTSYGGCLLIALILAMAAAAGLALT